MRSVVVGILLLGAPVLAGWDNNRQAPDFDVDAWVHEPESKSLTGLRGKVVLLALWPDLERIRADQIDQLQEFHDRYGNRGLRVIAVVRAEPEFLSRWVTRHRVTFGLARATKVKGYGFRDKWVSPVHYLIRPDGVIEWGGHPMLFSAGHIERLLPTVKEFVAEGSGEGADAFRAGRLGEAAQVPELRARTNALLAYWRREVEVGLSRQRYVQVFSSLERVSRHFPDSIQAEQAIETMRELRSDTNVERERAAEAELAFLLDRARRARTVREVTAIEGEVERLVESTPTPACGAQAGRLLADLRLRLEPLQHVPPIVNRELTYDRVGFERPGPRFERRRPTIRIAKSSKRPELSITRLFFCREGEWAHPSGKSMRGVDVGLWTPCRDLRAGNSKGARSVYGARARKWKGAWSVRPETPLPDGVYCVHTGEIGGKETAVPKFCAPFVVGGYGKPSLRSTQVKVRKKRRKWTVQFSIELENLGDGTFSRGYVVTTVQQIKVLTGSRGSRSTFRARKTAAVGELAPGGRNVLEIEWPWAEYGPGTFYFTVGLNYTDLGDLNRIFNGRSKSFTVRE